MTIVISALYYLNFGKGANNFYGDALGYYLYLPTTFIYHNHTSIERLPDDRQITPFIHSYVGHIGARSPKGYVIDQYTYGIALMEAPFFFAAHAWEKISGGLANGFTEPYRTAIDLSSIFYSILGLVFTYKVLRRRFSAQIASCTTAMLLLGTNLFWFTLQQQGMAHVPLFFLFALLLWFTVLVYERGRWSDFIGLGLTAGLITLIRPVDGLCVLIPLLYDCGAPYFRRKWDFIWRRREKIFLSGTCFLLPIIPQLLYWKWLTGYSVYDSYGPDQKFDFLHPHILQGLFSAANGWFCYTPLMLAAVIGLAFIRRLQPYAFGVLAFLVLYVWVVFSWFLWAYPNGLGARPMVDVYAVMSIPLAITFEWISKQKWPLRMLAGFLIACCVALNLNYTLQQFLGNMRSDDSSYSYNFHTLFRYRLNYNDLVVWDTRIIQPDARGLVCVDERCVSPDSAASTQQINDTLIDGAKIFVMREGEEYGSPFIERPYSAIAGQHVRWLRGSGIFMTTLPEYDVYENALMVLQIRRAGNILAWYGVRINNKVGLLEDPAKRAELFTFRDHVRGRVSFFVPVPKDIRPADQIKLDVWNIGKKPLRIYDLCLAALK